MTVPVTATVLEIGEVEFSRAVQLSLPTPLNVPFEETLKEGDGAWMWKEKGLETLPVVLVDGIATNEATLISDGSYYMDLAPSKGGACWILETHGNRTYQPEACFHLMGTIATTY